MNALLPWMLIALALVACDRRDVQTPEASDTTDTVVADPATAPPADSTDPLPPPATAACAGLTGEVEAACAERERVDIEPPPIGNPEDDSTPP